MLPVAPGRPGFVGFLRLRAAHRAARGQSVHPAYRSLLPTQFALLTPHITRAHVLAPPRVKRAVATSTSFGGLPTSMDYHMTKKEEEVGGGRGEGSEQDDGGGGNVGYQGCIWGAGGAQPESVMQGVPLPPEPRSCKQAGALLLVPPPLPPTGCTPLLLVWPPPSPTRRWLTPILCTRSSRPAQGARGAACATPWWWPPPTRSSRWPAQTGPRTTESGWHTQRQRRDGAGAVGGPLGEARALSGRSGAL